MAKFNEYELLCEKEGSEKEGKQFLVLVARSFFSVNAQIWPDTTICAP